METRFRLWGFLLIAAILFLAPFGSLAADPLKIGLLRLTSSAPIFIAEEEGFFEAEGAPVQLKFMESAQPIAAALAGRDIDIGATGLTAGLYNAMAGGLDAFIVADKGREWPGYRLTALMVSNQAWDEGLRDIKGLEGRRIGVTQIGSTFHYMLGKVLQRHGIPISKVQVTPLGGIKNMMDAIAANRIEAAFMVQPHCTAMEEKKMGRIMFWVSEHLSYQIAGIFMAGRIARDEGKALPFLRAYIRACRLYYDNCLRLDGGKPQKGPEAQKIAGYISKYTGRPAELIAEEFNYNDRDAILMEEDIKTQIDWYHENGLLKDRPDPSKIVDSSLLKKALSQLGR